MMRHAPLLLAFAVLVSAAATPLRAADPQRAITVNARISPPSKEIDLNQPLRIEFVTTPRQVENIDIAAAVANAVALSGTPWRMLGRPVVSEHEKTHTITVSFALLPRRDGNMPLPQIPLTWLQGDSYAEFGPAKVSNKVAVGGEELDPPKECVGVAGFIWGDKLADVKTTRIADNLIKDEGSRVVATPQPGLELIFRGGELAEAVVAAPGLTLDQARDSFFTRWGLPQLEEPASGERPASITWIIGWTRITATQGAGDAGVRLALVREDIESRQSQERVKGAVFDVLEGANLKQPAETDDQAKERRKREAEEFLKAQQAARKGADGAGPAPAPAAQAPASDAPKNPSAPEK
jgi:hypothetical protein